MVYNPIISFQSIKRSQDLLRECIMNNKPLNSRKQQLLVLVVVTIIGKSVSLPRIARPKKFPRAISLDFPTAVLNIVCQRSRK